MSEQRLRDEVVKFDRPGIGTVLAVLPVVPEWAHPSIREGIARRRVAVMEGRCPCGAEADFSGRKPGEVGVGEVAHNRGCPAVTETLIAAMKRWHGRKAK